MLYIPKYNNREEATRNASKNVIRISVMFDNESEGWTADYGPRLGTCLAISVTNHIA